MANFIENKCCICGSVGGMRNDGTQNFLIQANPDDDKLICLDCEKKLHRVVRETEAYSMAGAKTGPEPMMNEEGIVGQSIKATPSTLKKALDKYIIGQEIAKRKLSTAVYSHQQIASLKEAGYEDVRNVEKSNVMLVGPSGCGKTALIKRLASYLNVPFIIEDITGYSSTGYVGKDVEGMLRNLVQSAGGDIKLAERGIIYIDEIDKCARKGESASLSADPSHEDLQHGLLKIIEGSVIEVAEKGSRLNPQMPTFKINTENILFIVGGAFEGIEKIIARRMKSADSAMGFGSKITLDENKKFNDYIMNVTTEDLKEYGIIPELLGRLPIVCPMQALDEKALVSILKDSKASVIEQYKEIFRINNACLEFSDEALVAIAHKAIERKTGARSLRSIVETLLSDTIYSLPDNDVCSSMGYYVDVDENKELTIESADLNEAEEEIA